MAKRRQPAEPQPPTVTVAVPLKARAPGQWLGLAALVALVGLATCCLYQYSGPPTAEAVTVPTRLTRANLPRFRADAWQLPDEPMLGFIPIPSGIFLMGSDPSVDPMAYANERWSQERLRGPVEMPLYYMARYEVTVAQLAAFAAASGYRLHPSALRAPLDHPATHVSWTDALAYSRWLESQLLQWSDTPPKLKQLLRLGWRITLPSEAEWEKAARTSDGRIFPWGDTPDPTLANLGSSSTRPVGSFTCAACAYGLADMSGNVFELTRSPLQPYPYDNDDRPADNNAAALFVMRGGAFPYTAKDARAATRGGTAPGERQAFIGFRLVLTSAFRARTPVSAD